MQQELLINNIHQRQTAMNQPLHPAPQQLPSFKSNQSRNIHSLQENSNKSQQYQQIMNLSNDSIHLQEGFPGKSSSLFEEKPVGKGSSTTMMSQYPDDYVPQQTSQSQDIQPLEKRILSKLWKVKHQAYIQLLKKFQNGQLLAEYQKYLIQFITDSNVQVQEKGFKILETYLTKKNQISIQTAPIFKVVIEKGLSSNKAEIVKTAQQILVQFFGKSKQLEDRTLNILIEGMNHKNQKIVSGCIDAFTPLLVNYGINKLQLLKPILKELEKHIQNNAANIRTSISNFFKEAYKWIGQPVLMTVNKFKKTVQEEINKFIQTYKVQPMIPLRVNQPISAPGSFNTGGLDNYSFAEAVDVITKFDSKWAQDTLKIVKWLQKKQALDKAIEAFSTPKILNKDYSHLVTLINRLLMDSNFNIIICGLKLLNNLASGLRKSFVNGAKVVFKEILFKLRDKKQPIVEEAHKVLKSLLFSLSLDEMVEKIKQNLVDKAPNMRVQTLIFIKNVVQKKYSKAIKQLIEPLKVVLGDAIVEVRQNALQTLKKIKSIFGIQIFGNIDTWKNIPKDKILKIKNQPEIVQEQKPEIKKQCFSSTTSITSKNLKTQIQPKPQPTKLQVEKSNIQKQTQNNSSRSNEVPIFSNSNMKRNPLANINNPVQQKRYQAYNNLLFNPLDVDFFVMKEKAHMESSSNILKLILCLVERSFSNKQITREGIFFLLMHDWKNHLKQIVQFFKNVSINPKHYDLIKENPQIYVELTKNKLVNQGELNPNILIQKLHHLSMQWKDSKSKEQPLKQALQLVNQYKKINCGSTDNHALINQIAVNLKGILMDKNPEVVTCAIRLAGDLVTMYIITKTKGKIVIPAVLRKFDDQSLDGELTEFLDKCLASQSSFLFSQLVCVLNVPVSRLKILSCIQSNVETFLPTSTGNEIKPLLSPILSCLNQSQELASKAQNIIDQIIRLHGQAFVIAAIKQNKITLPIYYMRKYKTQIPILNTKLLQKPLRIQQLSDPNIWCLSRPVSSQIQKLLGNLSQLPPPINQLSDPLPIDQNILNQIFKQDIYQNFSDLLVEWLFWRFHIQRPKVVLFLIEMAKKMVFSYKLDQNEMVVLLSGFIGTLELGQQVLDAICSFNGMFREVDFRKNMLLFYNNAIAQNPALSSELLYIIKSSYCDILNEHLVMLAKTPTVRNNKDFINFLKQKYDQSALKAYGFICNQAPKQKTLKPMVEQIQPLQKTIWIIECLKKSPFTEVKPILEKQFINNSQNLEYMAELYVQIFEKICEPFFRGQIKMQNFDDYTKHLLQRIQNINISFSGISRLLRTTIYLLSDVDHNRPSERDRMVKIVNFFLVHVLEKCNLRDLYKNILNILKDQVKFPSETPLAMLLCIKCISKLEKNIQYKGRQREMFKMMMEDALQFVDEMWMNYQTDECAAQKKLKIILLHFCESLGEFGVQICWEISQKHSSNLYTKTFMDPFFKKTKYDNTAAILAQSASKRLDIFKCEIDELQSSHNIFKQHPLVENNFPR